MTLKKICLNCSNANKIVSLCEKPLDDFSDWKHGRILEHPISWISRACDNFEESTKYPELTPLLREIQIAKDVKEAVNKAFNLNSVLPIYSHEWKFLGHNFNSLISAISQTYFPQIEFIQDQQRTV